MSDREGFEVRVEEPDRVGETLVVGLSNVGMAGMTAADYLIRHRDCDRIGRVVARGLPAVVPFEDGTPRYHSRLHCLDEGTATVLVSEIYLDPVRATSFVDALTRWLADAPVEEVVVLNGMPYPHGPDDHRVFHVGTASFRERWGDDWSLPSLRGGFLEGVPAELLGRAMEGAIAPTAAYVTPAHPPGPDLDAAIRFLEALGSTHGIEADVTELRELSEETNRYYAELSERMQKMEEGDPRDDVGYM